MTDQDDTTAQPVPPMAVTLEPLGEALLLSEERRSELATGGRFSVQHSLNLHRSKAGVTEIETMIAHLRVEYGRPHIQIYATWETEPKGVA